MRKHFGDLIIRMAQKDNEAFEEIYNETKNLVFSIIYPIIGDIPTTEDLMQDTYIKMLRRIELYNPKKSFTPWLGQIAKNIAFDHLRNIKKEKIAHQEIAKISFTEKPTDIDFNELVMNLDEEKRRIVLLKTVGNLSFKKIANLENKPLGTVYSIYRLAIKELEHKLRKEVTK
jgi:RNA polymerase sigma-70 factor, ECF subfamily